VRENAGKTWTKDQDAELRRLFREDYILPHIAEVMGRSEGSIVSRAVFLGLLVQRSREGDYDYYRIEREAWATQAYLKQGQESENNEQ
jgi:hypothetical protein